MVISPPTNWDLMGRLQGRGFVGGWSTFYLKCHDSFRSMESQFCRITMENHHFIAGYYFYGHLVAEFPKKVNEPPQLSPFHREHGDQGTWRYPPFSELQNRRRYERAISSFLDASEGRLGANFKQEFGWTALGFCRNYMLNRGFFTSDLLFYVVLHPPWSNRVYSVDLCSMENLVQWYYTCTDLGRWLGVLVIAGKDWYLGRNQSKRVYDLLAPWLTSSWHHIFLVVGSCAWDYLLDRHCSSVNQTRPRDEPALNTPPVPSEGKPLQQDPFPLG